MAKRRASTQINHDNWNDPVEEEDAGTFAKASEDTMQRRVLKTAKRRIKPSEGNSTAFASFTGFKPANTMSNSISTGGGKPFGFLADFKSSSTTNGSAEQKVAVETKSDESHQEKYLTDLKQLNCNLSDWIKKHVDTDPVCILTPVFADYEKHLKEIQRVRDNGKSTVEAKTSSANPTSLINPSKDSNIKFGLERNSTGKPFEITLPTTASSTSEKDSSSGFTKNLGRSPLSFTSDDKATTPLLFSSFKSETSGSSLFAKQDPSSLMVNPFLSTLNKPAGNAPSNGTTTTTEKIEKEKEEQEESDEPPKVEFTPVQEEGSVFSTRCKVFVKKGNNYADRGLGTLFVKKVGEDKHQLLIRAETVLGNILVNVLLSSGVPLQRMGKNNVMLVCLPTPQDPPPPTTVLLRVKTANEADELLATLQKYKN